MNIKHTLVTFSVTPEANFHLLLYIKKTMKLFETQHTFDTPFDKLTLANWRKYPNDLAQHVLSVDVLDRKVTPSGTLLTERLLVCHQSAPSILKTLGIPISETAYFRELSVLDPDKKTYTATTINLTSTNILTVEETCVFEQDPIDPTQSLFTQNGNVVAGKALSYLGRLVEDAAVSRFYANSSRGREALQMVIDRISKEYDELEDVLLVGYDELKRELGNAAYSIEKLTIQATSSIESVAKESIASIEDVAMTSIANASESISSVKESIEQVAIHSIDNAKHSLETCLKTETKTKYNNLLDNYYYNSNQFV